MFGCCNVCVMMSAYAAILFVLLSPGVLTSLPPRGSLTTKVFVHGLVFLLIFHYTKSMIGKCSCNHRHGYYEKFEEQDDSDDDE